MVCEAPQHGSDRTLGGKRDAGSAPPDADTAREACGVVECFTKNIADRTPPASPSSASTPSSTADRRAPASPRQTAIASTTEPPWASSARASPKRPARSAGHISIAHTRYSTTGSNRIVNAQPVIARGPDLELALAHNGNVINALKLRRDMEEQGFRFDGTSDTEIIASLLANAPAQDWADRISHLMRRLKGAYSLTVLTKNELIGIRDPLGVRPLCLGRLGGRLRLGGGSGDSAIAAVEGWVIASESCALDHVGADYIRDIEPGEAVLIDDSGLRTVKAPTSNGRRASCVFENIYFSRPDSVLDGRLVYSDRMRMGAELAREHPVAADMVIGVPDSATAAAVGYAQESGIPYGEGLVKNRYVGRTFIEPTQYFRDLGVRRKLNPLPGIIRGKRLVVVDDSIVRGTTTPPRRQAPAQGRRGRDTPAHNRATHRVNLPLRRGHGYQEGADRGQYVRRGHPRSGRRRLSRLPECRGAVTRHRRQGRQLLCGVLHRRVSDPRPAGNGQAGDGGPRHQRSVSAIVRKEWRGVRIERGVGVSPLSGSAC